MKTFKINISILKVSQLLILFFIFPWTTVTSAEDGEKKALISLSFNQNDSERICTATVTSENKPVKGSEIHFYVKRSYSLLPINKSVETDSSGKAVMHFPLDIPGDKDGNYTVVAKIEDDDNFGTVVTQSLVKWGVIPEDKEEWGGRSLSASRDKAPMILIIVSNSIIAVIWGTIFFVMYQIVRIRKASSIIKSKNK